MTHHRDSSQGMTLVEILVVIAVLSALLALLLPAVQYCREAARKITCRNNLRQIATAVVNNESAFGQLASNGWGFQWVGDAERGSGPGQCGGWIYSMLPYMEARSVHDMGRGYPEQERKAELGKMLQTPVPVLVCPSRRKVGLKPFLGQYPLHNAVKPALAFKSDYAGCGGDERLKNGFGPADDSPQSLARYKWPDPAKASGVFYAGSRVRLADITDGLSNTYVAGEKYVRIREATGPEDRDFGDDQAAYIGDDRDIRRWTAEPPRRDERDLDSPDTFGSRHPNTWNALFGDGSVRSMAYNIDADVHRSLGNRRDGGPAAVP